MARGEATPSRGTEAGTLAVLRGRDIVWGRHGEVFQSFREKLGASWLCGPQKQK